MKLKKLILMALTGILLTGSTVSAQVTYEHVRNATCRLSYNDTVFVIDPMLAEKGRYPGFAGTFNSQLRNPLVDLPTTKEDVLKGADAIIVTHTHLDHWDEVAQQTIRKDIPIFTQNDADAQAIRKEGFTNVRVLTDGTVFKNVTLQNIEGTHGTQAMYDNPVIGGKLGDSMGVVFSEPNEKTTYLMGDTVWTPRINKTLRQYNPDILIMNTGYAKLLGYNEGIIMGTADVAKAASIMPNASIITVHMDAINHCTVSRANMRDFVHQMKLDDRVYVPNDGESVTFPSKK